MTSVRPAKQFAAVLAAFAGFSLSVAYAAPNYAPPALSPVDATTLNSSSPLLNNFNGYLDNIQAQLVALSGKTLAIPAGDPSSIPLDADFYSAVAAAVNADPDHAEQIVSAAVQYKPAKVKDIVKAVVLATPGKAPEAVAGAAHAVPTRGADAATGAILALVATAGTTPTDLAAAADDAVIAETRELIEKVAKAAVAATKGTIAPAVGGTAAAQGASALAVAQALVAAYSTDVVATNSNARLFADDLARGIIAGVSGFLGTDKSAVAGAILTKLSQGSGTTEDMAVNFAMGALKSATLIAGVNGYDDVKAALKTAAASFTGGLANVDDAIEAGAKAQKALRGAPAGTTILGYKAIFEGALDTAEVSQIGAFVSGAVQALKSKSADITKWALEDGQTTGLTLAQKQAIVAAAVTGNFGGTGKVVTAAISSNASGNALTASQAVAAAIPASTNLYSGAAVSAALKTVLNTSPTVVSDSQAVLSAAIEAATSANYANAIGDIVLSAVKSKKIYDNELVTTAINTVPLGWEEAVAAIVIANNAKDKPDLSGKTNETAALEAAAARPGVNVASVTLAINIAKGGKLSPKTLFDDAIEAAYANPTLPRAILFGAGAVNNKLAAPLLGMLLKIKSGGDSGSALHEYAVSLNKKGKIGLDLAYEAAVDALAYSDNIFDLVDHKILTNPKQAVDILSAVVAARPEYAHIAARAAAFRAPVVVGKTALAAVQFAHMRANRTATGSAATQVDDPAAVAAISAATVLGVKDAKLTSAKELAAIKAAIAGLVKGSLSFQNLDPADALYKKDGLIGGAFEEANGTGDSVDDPGATTTKRSKGTAAVLTGAVAQLQVNDPTTVENELAKLNPLAAAAITAATKAVKAHAFAFAQAAGAAVAAAAAAGGSTFTEFSAIADAILAAYGLTATKPGQTQLINAAMLGADQFFHGYYGSGAAGVLNYSQVSGNGAHISDISNF